jgi:hypothetical protein
MSLKYKKELRTVNTKLGLRKKGRRKVRNGR